MSIHTAVGRLFTIKAVPEKPTSAALSIIFVKIHLLFFRPKFLTMKRISKADTLLLSDLKQKI